MKKIFRALLLFLGCGLFLILAGFLALGMYYRNNFPVNTWINGVYCTGKTVEEVNRELAAQTQLPVLTLQEADGSSWQVDLQDLDAAADYTGLLRDYLRQHASFFWLANLNRPAIVELEPACFVWNEEKLESWFMGLSFVQEEKNRPAGVNVSCEDGEYCLYDGNTDRLAPYRAFLYLKECLSKGQTAVSLEEGGCYGDLEDSAADRSQRELWSQVEAFLDCGIVYDMGAEQIALTPEITGTFLAVDEAGKLQLDQEGHITVSQEKVADWVENLALQYDTCGTTKEFQSTRGDLVSVKYVTYGTQLDQEAETNYLMEALAKEGKRDQVHVPAYLQQGYVRGLDDIGGTYIEVDMTEQHLYYYVDGELQLDTDIVTGNLSTRHGTPQGINFVYNKQRDRILRGPDYASPVKYWMPVKGSIGIHDADWRSKFGGTIYKTNGSHGCINIPPKVMPDIYEMTEIGTPVIMFY